MRSPVDKVTASDLRAIGLFGGLADDLLEFFCASASPARFEPGQEVYREGEAGNAIFVVLEGELELVRKTPQGELRLALLRPGEWVGEVGALDMMPRSVTVRAMAQSQVFPVSSASLNALYRRDLKAYSLLVLNIARELCRRLRAVDDALVEARCARPA